MAKRPQRLKQPLLNTPIIHRAYPWHDPNDPPHYWTSVLGLSRKQWCRYVEQCNEYLQSERAKREKALLVEAGIDPTYPRRFELLLAWILQRFEGGFTNEPSVFAREGIDPSGENAVKCLVLKLARQHIPGFREDLAVSVRLGRKDRKLRARDVILFAVTIARVQAWLEQTGCTPSDRQIARVLLDLQELSLAIGEADDAFARFLVMPDGPTPDPDANHAWNRLWLHEIVALHHRLAEEPQTKRSPTRKLRRQARELGLTLNAGQRWLSESWLQKRIGEVRGAAGETEPSDFQRMLIVDGLEIFCLFRKSSGA